MVLCRNAVVARNAFDLAESTCIQKALDFKFDQILNVDDGSFLKSRFFDFLLAF